MGSSIKQRAFFLLQGGVGLPQAIFHISNANVIGRTPGGLACCGAALEAMFLYGGVFSVSLDSSPQILNKKGVPVCIAIFTVIA